jgi:hypothetical protein
MMQRTPVASQTPSASLKLRVAMSHPSLTGNVQADGIRRSPIGELGGLIVCVFYFFVFLLNSALIAALYKHQL